jgi:hypothetical protein
VQPVRRRHLVELEDLSWWPPLFRDAATDYLVAALRHAGTYVGLAPRLAAAVQRAGASRIIDLCSGGGGPWPELLPALQASGVDVPVCLTDKYPNAAALRRVADTTPGVRFEREPVSATDVPDRLAGFRTVFTAFHHFRPDDARSILAAAVGVWQRFAITWAIVFTIPSQCRCWPVCLPLDDAHSTPHSAHRFCPRSRSKSPAFQAISALGQSLPWPRRRRSAFTVAARLRTQRSGPG